MAYRKRIKKLKRKASARRALLRMLTLALFEKGAIETTQQRAVALKGFVDRVVRTARGGGLASTRRLARVLSVDRKKLVFVQKQILLLPEKRSGFVSLSRLARRRGDGALIVKAELVKKAQVLPKKAKKAGSKKVKDE